MKNFLILFLITVLLASCNMYSDDETKVVDAGLLGEWVKVEKRELSTPSPELVYSGWSISPDGTMEPLRIDVETGEVSHFDNVYSTRIEFARDGKMLVERQTPFTLSRDTVPYTIDDDKITLKGSSLEGTYDRTFIGSIVTSPPRAEFFVDIDGEETEIRQKGIIVPTAYISKVSESEKIIRSHLEGKNHRVTVVIDDFKGSGIYSIDEDQGSYSDIGGNIVSTRATDTDSSGTITIRCDDHKHRCSGEFEFITNLKGSSGNPGSHNEFKNGTFDLPVYK